MKVYRTFDKELVKSIMTNPDIWETVAEDGQEIGEFEPEVESDCWLAVEDDSIIGLYNLHPHNSVMLEIHCQILPEFRKRCSVASAYKFYEWFLDECPRQYEKLVCFVPTLYPNVRAFCKTVGFNDEGLIVQSDLIRGQLYDQWVLGITRSEIESNVKSRREIRKAV